jgi:hypothetical protein
MFWTKRRPLFSERRRMGSGRWVGAVVVEKVLSKTRMAMPSVVCWARARVGAVRAAGVDVVDLVDGVDVVVDVVVG